MKVLHFFNASFYAGDWTPRLDLPGCEMSRDKRDIGRCDAVIFHAASLTPDELQELPALRRALGGKQIWVLESEESAAIIRHLDDKDFLALFDCEMSYRRSADVWTPFIPPEFGDSYAASGPARRRRRLCCAFLSSNWDQSARREFMAELAGHMDIHSYGRFMRNRRIWFDRGVKSKLRVLRRYAFTLAFENSIAPDYVTEKFFQPFLTGTVPVYLGAPNVAEFAPGENCYVNTADFDSPAALAEHLVSVDPAAYHAWRKQPLRPEFRDMLQKVQLEKEERLSKFLLEGKIT